MPMLRKILDNTTCSFCQREKDVCVSVQFAKEEDEAVMCWACLKKQVTWNLRQKTAKPAEKPRPAPAPANNQPAEVKK
jgi:hypothetical protein